MNLTLGLRRTIHVDGHKTISGQLCLTCRSTYRVWLDGVLFGWGPARSAHGHVRVDSWPLMLSPGDHLIALEITAANVPAYTITGEPPFVQAELIIDEVLVAATGMDSAITWQALIPGERFQRVPRMSRQRAFCDIWRISPASSAWRQRLNAEIKSSVTLTPTVGAILQPRQVPLPDQTCLAPISVVGGGTITLGDETPLHRWETWMREDSGIGFAGFPRTQWEVDPWAELACWRFTPGKKAERPDAVHLAAMTWHLADFGMNRTGFFRARVRCHDPVVVWLAGDEILSPDGSLDCRRNEYLAASRFSLTPGEYEIEGYEPITARYLLVAAIGGSVEITDLSMRLCRRALPPVTFACADPALDALFDAAVRTFADNALDIFLDCPSRERAGWLCDSFFTARTASWLCGNLTNETLFLENYSLVPNLDELEPGMLPKCYPADGLMGPRPAGTRARHIPNWCLWLVLQIEEFALRGGDPVLIATFSDRCQALFQYLDRYCNTDGLLEAIDDWVFVDWSTSNDHVQGVNHPTNMLYAAALDAAGRLYHRHDWCERAQKMRSQLRLLAWNGHHFGDQAKRDANGELKLTPIATETCQYYAFFSGVATPTTHPELWQELVEQCSLDPALRNSGLPPAGAFVGWQMRLILLARHGEHSHLAHELVHGFSSMVQITGTLWEHQNTSQSCNHGYSSHVAHLLLTDVLGLSIDFEKRNIVLRPPNNNLLHCRTRIPLHGTFIEVGWERGANGVRSWIEPLPPGWSSSLPS